VRELQARQERLERLVSSCEREAKHPTETPHLSLGELVLRVRLEARVEDLFYRLERRRREEGVEPLSEEEAISLANEQLHAMRRERRVAP
jgi:hypothetical protein